MLRNRIYYQVKPFIPRALRAAVRRRIALRLEAKVRDVWPIMPGSEQTPPGWQGWPDGKKFAVVLTHDVEGSAGLRQCQRLMDLELKLGFRSSFNFIPEGSYTVTPELRSELGQQGFEVGVHDLKHDGRLFHTRQDFAAKAKQINHYLHEWNASGFRSGFMLHNLDWLHDLEIQYDASTFDTDPFEPQPEGRHTIFPFWVSRPAMYNYPKTTRHEGYVEMPYTLPQDSTLFLLLGETSIDIWTRKIDWIAAHGGMVLLNTHPDYMAVSGLSLGAWEYPASFYEELLQYIATKHRESYWHALPRQVASYFRNSAGPTVASASVQKGSGPHRIGAKKPKIWIDLDNTPHVPLFEPIVEELMARGFPLFVTARDAFQVCELADKQALGYLKVGRHYGRHRLLKGAGLIYRSAQLARFVIKEKPALAISHGARSQLLLGNWLNIPTVLMEDYEYCQFPPTMRPTWVIAPAIIPNALLPSRDGNIRKYSGIKENIYSWKFTPDASLLQELGIASSDLLVTVRPPATEAHYHNPQSERLFERFMDRAWRNPNTRVVLLPRNWKQGQFIRNHWPSWFKDDVTIIPSGAVDGLNLLWHSDLVVSGGGTMNREAAALGVPVYSIFRGKIGAVDRYLREQGKLVLVDSNECVDHEIRLLKRERRPIWEVASKQTLNEIVNTIEEISEIVNSKNAR
jgi:predicted glycosyltransferase